MGKRLVRVDADLAGYITEQLGPAYEQGTEGGADAIRVIEHLLKLHEGWDVPLDVEDDEPEAETGLPERTYAVVPNHPLFEDEELRERLELDEGRRNQMYDDTKGIPTIGIGHNLRYGVSEQVVDLMFDEDLHHAIRETLILATSKLIEFERLSVQRQRVLVEMTFQMGPNAVRGFRRMWDAIARSDWRAAYSEMLDSKWAREDSPARAKRAADRMLQG